LAKEPNGSLFYAGGIHSVNRKAFVWPPVCTFVPWHTL